MYPTKRYWKLPCSERISRYVETGGKLLCPAVIGACGESVVKIGQYWYRRSGEDGPPHYALSLEEAKRAVEAMFA